MAAGVERTSLLMLWLPKQGKRVHEHEDAARASFQGPEGRGARMAVADGREESPFAGEWARILARGFAGTPPGTGGIAAWLEARQREWSSRVPWDDLPWHSQVRAEGGAQAAVLGAAFAPGPELRWQAFSAGDAGMFTVRGRELTARFPAQPGGRNELVSSSPEGNGELTKMLRTGRGACLPGDRVVIATGAMARWFEDTLALGKDPWGFLERMNTAGWHPWVRDKQQRGDMQNDDVTLVTFKISGEEPGSGPGERNTP